MLRRRYFIASWEDVPMGVRTKKVEIHLRRRSVQSQAKNLVFPLDEFLSSSVVNLTFLYCRPRDTHNDQDGASNEES